MRSAVPLLHAVRYTGGMERTPTLAPVLQHPEADALILRVTGVLARRTHSGGLQPGYPPV